MVRMVALPSLRLGVALAALLVVGARDTAACAETAPARSVMLSDGWLFQPDPNGVGDTQGWQSRDFDRSGWRPVTVPMAWDLYDAFMDGYEGVGWYAVELPADRVIASAWQRLRFGRANYRAKVWIDGHEAGENLNGYLPFEIAATPWLTPGHSARIVVRVENGVRYDWLPGATVVEWVQYGGLLEPVELLTTAPAHITNVSIRATPRGDEGRVAAVVEIENASAAAFAGRVRLESDGRAIEAQARVEPGATSAVALELALTQAAALESRDARVVRRAREPPRRHGGDRFRHDSLRRTLDRDEGSRNPIERAAAADPGRESLRRVPGPRARRRRGDDPRRSRGGEGDGREPRANALPAGAREPRGRGRARPAHHGGGAAQLVARDISSAAAARVRERSHHRRRRESARADGAPRRQSPVARHLERRERVPDVGRAGHSRDGAAAARARRRSTRRG